MPNQVDASHPSISFAHAAAEPLRVPGGLHLLLVQVDGPRAAQEVDLPPVQQQEDLRLEEFS